MPKNDHIEICDWNSMNFNFLMTFQFIETQWTENRNLVSMYIYSTTVQIYITEGLTNSVIINEKIKVYTVSNKNKY